MTNQYDDIIDLPHPVSHTHAPMPSGDRAAQFSPFAALTGYDEVIEETARRTQRKRIPDEQRKNELDRCFSFLKSIEGMRPKVNITFFVPERRKDGGEYVTLASEVRKIDAINGKLLLRDGNVIEMTDIWDIQSEAFDVFGETKNE